MALDKLKKLIGTDSSSEVEVKEEEYYKVSRDDYSDEFGPSGSKMVLLEPRAYSESQEIADYLKERNAVVVNLKRVTPDQAKRIVDFLSGTIYALQGDLQKIGKGIILCTPNNVNIQGKITEDKDKDASDPDNNDRKIELYNNLRGDLWKNLRIILKVEASASTLSLLQPFYR